MKSITKIVLTRLIGLFVFLILLAMANLLKYSITAPLYQDIIMFFNANLLLLFIILIIGTINDIFWSFKYNILAPIVSALLSIFIVTLIYRMLELIRGYVNLHYNIPITAFYIAVFIIVLLGGYITIIVRLITKIPTKKTKNIEWSDVGNEFKLFFYNMAKDLNRKPSSKSKGSPKKRK